VNERLHSCERQCGQLGQRVLEHRHVAGQQRAQHKSRRKLPADTQMADQRTGILAERGDRHRRLLAGFAHHRVGALAPEPGAFRDEIGQPPRQHPHEGLARRERQVGSRKQRFADRAEMTEPLDDAVDRGRRDIGMGIFDGDETGLGRADLGDRGGDRALERRARRNGGLPRAIADRDEIDELGVDKERRARENQRGNVKLVRGERMDDGVGRVRACGKGVCERMAHQRRGIVDERDHRAFSRGTVLGRQIGIEEGPCQCARGFGPLAGGRSAHPMQKLPNDHRATTLFPANERERCTGLLPHPRCKPRAGRS